MNPHIDGTAFGSITIAHDDYEHDVIIRLNGGVEKRKKKLSKAIYGTSHIVSLAEAQYVYEPGAQRLIVGLGRGATSHCPTKRQAISNRRSARCSRCPRLKPSAPGTRRRALYLACFM